ncbi:PP2C family protein-serine/threonine phosphatase [Desulfococcaceae bacterium HSG8]|nr:PP2C family protein-serine/threonine phosphatase [Desulfococcaceae bacterium HSG8]
MTAGKKLLLAISPLVILSVALIVFSYQSMKKIQAQIPDISEFAVTSTELVQAAKTSFDQQSKFYEDVVFMDDLDAIEHAMEASGEIAAILGKLGELSGIGTQTRSEIDNFLRKLKDYTDSASVIYVRMSEDDEFLEKAGNARIVNSLGEEKNRLAENLDSFSEMVSNELSRKIGSVNRSAKTRNNINAVISFVVIGLSVLLIFFLIERAVTRPMVETNEKLQRAMDEIWGEMELAKKIQTVLLPERPEIEGYDIIASLDPADEVGGDYYDVISAGGYEWIVIGDVSGHGVPAGLVMMMAQTAIHTVLLDNPGVPPSQLLTIINRTIYQNIEKMHESKHMTIVVLAGGTDGDFIFSGLHEDILIWRAETGKVDEIETNGMWIGMEEDISDMLPTESLKLSPGDCMVLFTDGVTEARGEGGDLFGNERLVKIIEKSGHCPVSEIHADVMTALEPYKKPDDVTLVVIKRNN